MTRQRPDWTPTCGVCRVYLLGGNGEVSTYKENRHGKVIELPMTHAEGGSNPPCGTCDKIPVGRPAHWDHAIEFDPWFHDVVQWYRESEAVNDFQAPNDTLRLLAGVVRAFDLTVERAAAADTVKAIIEFMGK